MAGRSAIEGSLAGLDSLQQSAPALIPFLAAQDRSRSERPGAPGHHAGPERGVLVLAILRLLEHTQAGQRSHQAVQRRFVCPGGLRQHADCPRPVVQQVGDSEPGRNVDDLGGPVAIGHLLQRV